MSELNRKELEKEFGIDFYYSDCDIIDIDNQGNVIENREDVIDALGILEKNIERANGILDRVEEEIQNGNFSARMVEVAGQIINSITNASKEIISDKNYNKYLQIREKVVLLEQIKIKMKRKSLERPTTQNVIIASREDVLKKLEEIKKENENCEKGE